MSTEKLNLSKLNINAFWKNADTRMARAISIMENVEHWTVDDDEAVARGLIDFGKKMSSASKQSLTRHSEDVISIMAYISCGKALKIMNWLDENHPGLSFHYVMESRQIDDWEPGRLLLDRLRTVHTLTLLSKIFSPSRTRLISELLKENKDDD